MNREEIAAEMELTYNSVRRTALNALVDCKEPEEVEWMLKPLKAKLHDTTYAYVGSEIGKHDIPLLKDHVNASRALRDNKQILVTKPDKGTGTVVIDRASYYSRIEAEILSDRTKFIRRGTVNMSSVIDIIEGTVKNQLKALLVEKHISEDIHDQLRPRGTQIPRLYGLPKIHKANCPFRPILSMSNSPQERIAKWLLQMLKPAVNFYTKFCVKDSFSFSDGIKTFSNVKSSGFMASYDVSSLFTNVPVKEAIEISVNYLYSGDQEIRPPTSMKTFTMLMELATVNVTFTFGQTVYQQVDGVAMGSPLGPALANIFLGYYEEKLFSETNPPLYYRRYVDDTFVMLQSEEEANEFLKSLNNLHQSLKFTCEFETDGKLPFLDVVVERSNNRLITSVYRKKTFTGQYMNWWSFAPRKRKINLIRTLTLRAVNICSPEKLEDELQSVRSILLKNGYPSDVVDFHVTKQVKELKGNVQHGPKPCPVYMKLPWIGDKSAIFQKQLETAVKSCFGALTLRTCYFFYDITHEVQS